MSQLLRGVEGDYNAAKHMVKPRFSVYGVGVGAVALGASHVEIVDT